MASLGTGAAWRHERVQVCLQVGSLNPEDSAHNYPHGAVALAPFLIAGGQAAVLLGAVEEVFHLTAQPVQGAVERTGAVFVGFAGDRDANAPPPGGGPDGVAAVALVATEPVGPDAGVPRDDGAPPGRATGRPPSPHAARRA